MENKEEKKGLGVFDNLTKYKRSTRLAIITIIYGVWLSLNEVVLERYLVYRLLENLISAKIIAASFIFVGVGSLLGIIIAMRAINSLFSTLTVVIWSTWAISFFITPPPNSVWIFSAFIACLSYEAIWVDRL